MKRLVKNIYNNPNYAKAIEWGKLISITSFAQILVQIIGFVCGILIIRMLTTQEYALYTLANTMLGTITVLSDGGITAGVMAQGGKVWQDKHKLGIVLVTGLTLRRKFGIWTLLITSPILVYLLLQHGASWLTIIFITLSLVPAFFAASSDSLLEVAPKLHQDINPLQINSLAANLGRLLLTGLTIFVFPWAFIAIIGGGIPRILANFQLKKISVSYVDWDQKSDSNIQEDILAIVRKTLPSSIYFCISSQITIWLISIFGSTEAVAQIGALGRLSMILSLFSLIIQILIIPRYARLPSNKEVIIKWFIMLQIILLIFSVVIVACANLFSTSILWIIGNSYAGLENVFVLSISSAVISSMAGVIYNVLISRNWILHPALSISLGILSQILTISLIDLSTVRGVYNFSIINNSISIILAYVFVFILVKRRKLI